MTPARPRPRVHFTPRRGWINDPHGVVRVSGEWHLFFQYCPGRVTWSAACHWGHATSSDLVDWTERDVALAPAPGEVGCWSGSCVVDDRGPVILYTSILDERDTSRGAVTTARPAKGMSGWYRDPPAPVISAGPEGVDDVRDPQVRREGDHWVAVLGGRLADGGCAVQYTSPDLLTWTYAGVLAGRPASVTEPLRTGTLWECPQFLRVDGRWVLVVSIGDPEAPDGVAYAIGSRSAAGFEIEHWGRFSYGPDAYATTTFTDALGRARAVSWLRESDNTAPPGSPWCGALSLAHVLSVSGTDLHVTFPDELEQALPWVAGAGPLDGPGRPVDLGFVERGATWRLQLTVAPPNGGQDAALEIRLEAEAEAAAAAEPEAGAGAEDEASGDGDGEGEGEAADGGGWTLRLALHSGVVVATAAAEVLLTMPAPRASGGILDLLVDADILEVTWSGGAGVGACRVPCGAGRLTLDAAQLTVEAIRLGRPR